MQSVTNEKLDQARREIRERKDKRNVYVRNWRESQRIQKRKTTFVDEYVRVKFTKVYSEALNFYSSLDQLHPEKKDLCRTIEFRRWRAALTHGNKNNNKKSTTVTHQAEQQRTDKMMLNIPLIPRSRSRPNPIVETQPETPPETTDETTAESQLATPPEIPVEIQPQPLATPPETTDETTAESQLATPPEIPVEIQPQPLATPPEIGAEFTVEMPLIQPETPLETDEQITDRRIQEIIEELRDDPDLNGIFNDFQPNNQIDEGIEVPTLEQELETDIGLIDYEPGFYQWS